MTSPNKRKASASVKSPAKKAKVDYTSEGVIRVLVGPSVKSFTAHKNVLCAVSDYFEAACSTRWEEGPEGVVRLSEADPEIFEVFLHWAYRRELDHSYVTEREPIEGAPMIKPPTYLTLGKIWSLGHYLQAQDLRNAVNDRIVEKSLQTPTSGVSTSTIAAIWEITPAKSTVQSLLLEILETGEELHEHLAKDKNMPNEVILHFACRFASNGAKRDWPPTLDERCDFHEHSAGPCCSVGS